MLYNLSIHLFSAALYLAAPFNAKAKKLRAGRKGLIPLIQSRMQDLHAQKPGEPTYWIHCASLGEFEQGRPVVEAIRKQRPQSKIVITFFSPSGYEVRQNYPTADAIFYLPADTPKNARQLVEAIDPACALFVKYELWHHILLNLRSHHTQTILLSAIFRPSAPFFKPWGAFFRNMLRNFTHIYVQNTESQTLLNTIGITNVTVAGDTRFDRVAQIVHAAKELPLVKAFADNHPTVVCGSTWPPDEAILAELINRNPNVRFIIAPHQIKTNQIEALIHNCPDRTPLRYTEADIDQAANANLLIINCIGILSSVYQYGEIAYIGGGFGVGIHNILEAATWGLPVIFGPNFHKFAEAEELVALGGARTVHNAEELTTAYTGLKAGLAHSSTIAQNYVNARCGATTIIINDLL